jgi:hypothetical protein
MFANHLLEKDAHGSEKTPRILRLWQGIEHNLYIAISRNTASNRQVELAVMRNGKKMLIRGERLSDLKTQGCSGVPLRGFGHRRNSTQTGGTPRPEESRNGLTSGASRNSGGSIEAASHVATCQGFSSDAPA